MRGCEYAKMVQLLDKKKLIDAIFSQTFFIIFRIMVAKIINFFNPYLSLQHNLKLALIYQSVVHEISMPKNSNAYLLLP